MAPGRLHLDRFLPPTLLRVIVDHTGKAQTKAPPAHLLQPGDPRRIVAQETFKAQLFPTMLEAAKEVATRGSRKPIETAIELATYTLESQISRLNNLSLRNPNISKSEIESLRATLTETVESLSKARIRLDSLRLIYCG
jgi:ATP-dependent helicase HepA